MNDNHDYHDPASENLADLPSGAAIVCAAGCLAMILLATLAALLRTIFGG